MKKVILLAVCLFSLSVSVNAQESPKNAREGKAGHEKMTPEQRAQKNVDDLNAIATLDAAQKTKVKDLALNRITKADAIRNKYKGQAESKETMQKELEVVKKEYRQSVKTLLTPEQLEKVKAKNKEMKASKSNERAASTSENAIDAND